ELLRLTRPVSVPRAERHVAFRAVHGKRARIGRRLRCGGDAFALEEATRRAVFGLRPEVVPRARGLLVRAARQGALGEVADGRADVHTDLLVQLADERLELRLTGERLQRGADGELDVLAHLPLEARRVRLAVMLRHPRRVVRELEVRIADGEEAEPEVG